MLKRVGSPVMGQFAECRPIVLGSRAELKPCWIVADSVQCMDTLSAGRY